MRNVSIFTLLFSLLSVQIFSSGIVNASEVKRSFDDYTEEQKMCLNYGTESGNFHVAYQKYRKTDLRTLENHIAQINEASTSKQRGTVFLSLSSKMKELKPRTVKYVISFICLTDKDFDRDLEQSKLKSCEGKNTEKEVVSCVRRSI